ncbi:rod-binding protein [Beijerinckia indica]|uniref:Flagellar protein FlgJ N-terminal domain-containing protein n=1 Tax=Beijerinckia indica subsp. indica (strain ATCC 9039 / DSM 1715 / NCIMB 8712) TaxID=395963 RepID=B2IG69_BEII9|nr:rod-binding protein [Beijerinckia indica]ACB97143.1 hypothetical protein Bind_3587 [Beijerinckia indica subsp. indica ATCC 9039]
MSIQPPSDIVLDVANAAGPISPIMARERLGSTDGSSSTNDVHFSHILDGVGSSEPPSHSLPLFLPKPRLETPSPNTRTKVFKDLETVLLRNFVEAMLPKNTEDVFGHGTAGNIWKSMMADQLSKEIGKRLDLGIGKVAATRMNYAGMFHSSPVDDSPFFKAVDIGSSKT